MKRAIVVGASSGIGEALALVLSREGYAVGLTGQEEAMAALEELIGEMGGADLIVINSGVRHQNPEGKWERVEERSSMDHGRPRGWGGRTSS